MVSHYQEEQHMLKLQYLIRVNGEDVAAFRSITDAHHFIQVVRSRCTNPAIEIVETFTGQTHPAF
jgi:hypothetical protein